MFTSYLQLLDKIDRFAARLRAKYPRAFACRPRCADCCVAGIRIWRVEYDNIAASNASNARNASNVNLVENERTIAPAHQHTLSRMHQRTKLRTHDRTNARSHRCPLLDTEGRCTIYGARPVVCRLWGLPQLLSECHCEPAEGGRGNPRESEGLLRYPRNDTNVLTCCEQNFVQGVSLSELPPSDTINQQTVLTTLAAINHVYCWAIGTDPEERLPLAR